jgi:hypothetical protein
MAGAERANPVLGTLLTRDLLPFVPVWLLGVVLAASLDYSGFVGPRLPISDLDTFALSYSLVVAGMASLNFLRHYRSAPRAIVVGTEGLTVSFHNRSPAGFGPDLPFGQVRAIYISGFFGPHLDAVPPGSRGVSMPLTAENARLVASAWTAWQGRTAEPSTAVG